MYKKPKKSWKDNIIYIACFVVLFVIDQISKKYFIDYYENNPNTSFFVTSFLNFEYVWNQGISFGFFSDWEYSNLVFIVIASLIAWYFISLFNKEHNKSMKYSYIFIIGGAAGNIVDRIRYGAVYDFIDFHIFDYHWPAFNFADTYITVGGFLLLTNLFSSKVKKNEKNKI